MVDSIFSTPIEVMVLILDGKSKIGAHIRSNLDLDLALDLFKTFDVIESSHKLNILSKKT